jgi:hypothetical protein
MYHLRHLEQAMRLMRHIKLIRINRRSLQLPEVVYGEVNLGAVDVPDIS